MTIAMPDSTNVNNLPAGYPAYLGYADGAWPTAKVLEGMFPDAQLVILTVTGQTAAHGARVAPGTDAEPGDLTAASAASWAYKQPKGNRPVIYASVEGQDGYGMNDVRDALAALGVPRSAVRLLSAHYGAGEHICGPHSCSLIDVDMDGTQWTNQWIMTSLPRGPLIDMSTLADDFFGPVLTETERLVTELGTVQSGMTGAAVKTVQGLCVARGADLAVDGIFGGQTLSAVKFTQSLGKVTVDGIVGPQTWPVLLGVA
jgi:peptidoglycan hydrolase-like protein with peptidoglycan-binding domain